MTITKALLKETLESLAETFEKVDELDHALTIESEGYGSTYLHGQHEWVQEMLENQQEELEDEVDAAVEGINHISHFLEELNLVTKEEWEALDKVFRAVINRLEAKK
jgi:hypothetical protein